MMLLLVVLIVLHIEFGVFLQIMGRMEVTCSFAPIDGNLWNSGFVDNHDGIAIG